MHFIEQRSSFRDSRSNLSFGFTGVAATLHVQPGEDHQSQLDRHDQHARYAESIDLGLALISILLFEVSRGVFVLSFSSRRPAKSTATQKFILKRRPTLAMSIPSDRDRATMNPSA